MMKFSIKTSLLASAILSILAIDTASASVIKLTDNATLQQREAERYFSQSGLSGEKVVPMETAGADRPLSLATKLIIPDSWIVKPSGNFDNAIVSWKGGVSWPNILYKMAQDEAIYINLDWVKKIASIHVPGETQSEMNLAKGNKEKLDVDCQAFRKKERQNWERRDFRESEISVKDQQFSSMIEKQRLSQIANQDYIANLDKTNRQLENDLNELQSALELERKKREGLENKFSVIDPTLKKEKPKDVVELSKEFEKLWVKPFDDSFLYYKNGGHRDIIEYHTPASYIAKKGSIEDVLRKWAERVGWYVEYTAGIQHENPYEVVIKGSFIEASTSLIRIFEASSRPLNISYFPDITIEMEDGTKRKGLVKVTDLNYSR